jgi:hypothetical protein
MPRIGATIYDILLSCPSDVADLKPIVKECLDEFNRLFGDLNNIRLELKHWSSDSYPKSGGKAQNLLNEIFIHDCDMCIALLGNRFGTPTEKYDSGTQEEIEDMINANKQVFMYFIERAVDPSKIDLEQLQKVRDFRLKYTDDKGIYTTIKSNDDFKKELLNHITLYFLDIITSNEKAISSSSKSPLLSLKVEEPKFWKSTFGDTGFINKYLEQSKRLIADINSVKIVKKKSLSEKDKDNIYATLNFSMGKAVVISPATQSIINTFATKNAIILNEDFFDVGDLSKSSMVLVGTTYYGDDESKRKYNLICNLRESVMKINDFINFTEVLDGLYRLALYIENSGTLPDEDIDITLKISKGCICQSNDLPIPQLGIIEIANNSFETIFTSKSTHSISSYKAKPTAISPTQYIPPINPMLIGGKSEEDEYEEFKEEYLDKIENYFVYTFFDEKDIDVIQLNIFELKHNTKMYFPTHLFFKNKPSFINYEIRSKHTTTLVTGSIDFSNDK